MDEAETTWRGLLKKLNTPLERIRLIGFLTMIHGVWTQRVTTLLLAIFIMLTVIDLRLEDK